MTVTNEARSARIKGLRVYITIRVSKVAHYCTAVS